MNRDELHGLIDRLPEDKLDPIAAFIAGLMNRAPENPRRTELHHRGREYRKRVEENFRQTLRPGTIGCMGGSGFVSAAGEGLSSHGFHYWDGKAVVFQTMRYFSGQEIEHMERLRMSDDGTRLIYEQEISSGGHTARREESFPVINSKT
jgi:hypothetical protein